MRRFARPGRSRNYATGLAKRRGARMVRVGMAALLPLKSHSERIPAKNFRTFSGKPLYRWILDTLLSMSEIDLVVINTDARTSLERSGLKSGGRIMIRNRPEDLRGGHVSMNRIIADDLGAVDAPVYLMTHATNPLLQADTIRAAVAAFHAAVAKGMADSLFTVRRYQSRFYRADGSAVNHDPHTLIRTQDLDPWFEENSNLYIFTRDSFAATGARIGLRPLLYEMPKSESFDIDTMEDWHVAEALALHRRPCTRRSKTPSKQIEEVPLLL